MGRRPQIGDPPEQTYEGQDHVDASSIVDDFLIQNSPSASPAASTIPATPTPSAMPSHAATSAYVVSPVSMASPDPRWVGQIGNGFSQFGPAGMAAPGPTPGMTQPMVMPGDWSRMHGAGGASQSVAPAQRRGAPVAGILGPAPPFHSVGPVARSEPGPSTTMDTVATEVKDRSKAVEIGSTMVIEKVRAWYTFCNNDAITASDPSGRRLPLTLCWERWHACQRQPFPFPAAPSPDSLPGCPRILRKPARSRNSARQ